MWNYVFTIAMIFKIHDGIQNDNPIVAYCRALYAIQFKWCLIQSQSIQHVYARLCTLIFLIFVATFTASLD